MFTLASLLIVAGIAWYVMKPEERARVIRSAVDLLRTGQRAAMKGRRKDSAFYDALRERTPYAVVTPALAALSVAVFAGVVFAGGAGDPQTLLAWGGNFGPRTTNGEWWRLVSAMFVHAGIVHLLVSVIALASLGVVLERLVGHLTFTATFLAGGLFAALASLTLRPMEVGIGFSGAISALYGLLLASAIWTLVHRSALTLPLHALKGIAPGAAIFFLYQMVTDVQSAAVGLFVGAGCGMVLTRRISESAPPAPRLGVMMAAMLVLAMAAAVPLRGLTDVRPKIAQVVAVEERTARAYEAAVDRFRKGRISAEALAEVIESTIVPELQAATVHLQGLGNVPSEHVPVLHAAEEYLRLRGDSWRIRVEALETSNMAMLREADRAERESLDALDRVRPAVSQ